MKKTIGVEIWLEPKTRIPKWIWVQSLNVGIRIDRSKGRAIRVLRIRGGYANFGHRGNVGVRVPGSAEFWPAFKPRKVLKIVNLDGAEERVNWFLCPHCFTLTGEMVKETIKPGAIAGRQQADFQCRVCGHIYHLDSF